MLEARAGARLREYEEIVGHHLEQAHRALAGLGATDPRGRDLGERAAARLAAAGRRALAQGDLPAATGLLDRAVALLPPPPDGPRGPPATGGSGEPLATGGSGGALSAPPLNRGQLLGDLAESLVAAGEFRRADEVLEAAVAAGPDDAGLRAQVTVGRLGMRLLREPELAFATLREEVEDAIRDLDRLGDERGLAGAWRLLGYESFVRCRIEEAEQAMATAIEHARRAGDERLEAYGRGLLAAAAFWGPLPVSDGIDRCHRLLDEAAGNRYVEASVLHVLGALAAMQGRFAAAGELVDRGVAVAEGLGRLRLAAIWSQFAAAAELLAGRPGPAEERLARGYRTLERMGETGGRSNLAADLAHVLLAQGRHQEARRYAETSQELAARDDLYAQVRWRGATARLLAGQGRGDDAGRLAAEAVALADRTDMLNLRAGALLDLAETARLRGLPGDAAGAAGLALSLYEQKGNAAAAAAVRADLVRPPAPAAGHRFEDLDAG
jgi:tetratricopeptide (TPR) repeat protein